MKEKIVFLALVAAFGSVAIAAEDTSRTYANPGCSERNANPNDCLIQDGPPRRTAFPPPEPPQAKPGPKPAPSGGGGNVTILGGGNAKGGR
jgi:hypothetical protein